MISKKIPDMIKEIKARGWTLKELAKFVGRSHRTVEGWESGRNPGKYAMRVLNDMLKK